MFQLMGQDTNIPLSCVETSTRKAVAWRTGKERVEVTERCRRRFATKGIFFRAPSSSLISVHI